MTEPRKVAFLFPGQGSQAVGMGQDFAEQSEVAKAVFKSADEALGESLSKLCFEGPEDDLRLTANTQPAVLTASVAMYRALGVTPDLCAGHSLGEYTANVAAGVMSFEDAVRIVRRRGELMQRAVPDGQGAMAAVISMPAAEIERICHDTDGVVEPVNYNSAKQTVIAGSAEAVQAASTAMSEAGARVIPLSVSAPFHSSLMKPAEDALEPTLRAVNTNSANYPIFTNVDAVQTTDGDKAIEALIKQVSRPVLWEPIIKKMLEAGVGLFVEVGPGRVLTGLCARIDRKTPRLSLNKAEDLEKVRAGIAEFRLSAH